MSDKPEANPGELVIGTASKILVRIQPDGTIIYGPEYTPDEAAKTLWQALAAQMVEAEQPEEAILIKELMCLMDKLGRQDLRYEACALAAREPTATAHERFQEERAAQQLNVICHEVIELARGIALRNQALATSVSEAN